LLIESKTVLDGIVKKTINVSNSRMRCRESYSCNEYILPAAGYGTSYILRTSIKLPVQKMRLHNLIIFIIYIGTSKSWLPLRKQP
jgi:hypothetical protein